MITKAEYYQLGRRCPYRSHTNVRYQSHGAKIKTQGMRSPCTNETRESRVNERLDNVGIDKQTGGYSMPSHVGDLISD
jgi:hypothetical protein